MDMSEILGQVLEKTEGTSPNLFIFIIEESAKKEKKDLPWYLDDLMFEYTGIVGGGGGGSPVTTSNLIQKQDGTGNIGKQDGSGAIKMQAG